MDAWNRKEARVDIIQRLKEFGAWKLIRGKLRQPLAPGLSLGLTGPALRPAPAPAGDGDQRRALRPFLPLATLTSFVPLPARGRMTEILGHALVALVFVFAMKGALRDELVGGYVSLASRRDRALND